MHVYSSRHLTFVVVAALPVGLLQRLRLPSLCRLAHPTVGRCCSRVGRPLVLFLPLLTAQWPARALAAKAATPKHTGSTVVGPSHNRSIQ